ncbi:site-2 protease family protein [Streptomyces flavofungini]|uniref:site-2 protease family protein n=1 Tax=Streptomyces flavofungini TaxID=68200 RepID=UPI0025B27B78|nr:site-2 protease family protein [Streptomyces flavofungini]WJV44745.1 site-2 protease family protein [Streptomyces flavofungini]
MKETMRLGRIAGVRVGLHWSVLFIVVLVVLSLARGRFPHSHPGEPTWVYWALGVITAVVFLVSLLAHEMAHAVAARRNGVAVDGVTLWMLGGVARLRGEAKDPGTEFRVAGVGPLTSALAAVFFAGVAAWMEVLSAPGLAVECVGWLAMINLVLAVFNALPAAPLDGGRVLRAYLWHRWGDPVRAARGAAATGQFLGWFMLLTGFASVLMTGALGGLWAALVGWFLIAVATTEARAAELRGVLGDMAVRQVMTPDPVTVVDTATVAGFLGTMPFQRHRHTAFPVVTVDGAVVGLVSVRRINRTPLPDRSDTVLRNVMRPLAEVSTARPDDLVVDLMPRLRTAPERRALVLDGGRLVGIVAMSDVDRALSWLDAGKRTRH